MSIKNHLQREFKGSNFEIREKLITDTYFTSFLDYVSLPESISKLIEEGYADKRNQLDEYIDFALHHNLITMQKNMGTIYQFTPTTRYSISDNIKKGDFLLNGNRLLIMSKFFRVFSHILCQPFHTIGNFKDFQYQ